MPGKAILAAWVLSAVAGLAQTAQTDTAPSAFPQVPPADNGQWVDVAATNLDLDAITDRGRQILNLPDIDWKHAQTEHFVIHYEQAIFARKVARMAEFFYSYIAQDLQGAKDHVSGRSHIFIFRSEKRWKEFAKTAGDVPDWTFSRVEGTVMFLQQAENTSSSGDVLAHETTHLVMNRFFEKRCPLWLNEGLAEYYRVFAYSAYKGVKKSKRAQFGRLANPFPLEELLYIQLLSRGTPAREIILRYRAVLRGLPASRSSARGLHAVCRRPDERHGCEAGPVEALRPGVDGRHPEGSSTSSRSNTSSATSRQAFTIACRCLSSPAEKGRQRKARLPWRRRSKSFSERPPMECVRYSTRQVL